MVSMPVDPDRKSDLVSVDGSVSHGSVHVTGALGNARVTGAQVREPIPGDASRDDRVTLDRLWSRGTAFLGCPIAIMGGAMSWVSERHLVSAISNAGGFGVIACGSMNPDMLAAEIAGTQALTNKPFGVNLITMHPMLDGLVRVCLEANVSHVVLAGGIPPGTAVKAVKDGGARLICFAPALVLAKRLVRSGADAIVIEGRKPAAISGRCR
jgi:enoyl-[acyl-carrier protein] reductase II